MLSTAKVRTSSWRYYANQVGRGGCEYFLGIGEAPGRWYGRGLGSLGLELRGEVREWQLEATFGRAIHPTGRYRLGRAWRADGVTGYDLCFSAPKSVSVLWALGGLEVGRAVRAAHVAAVRAGLDYLDDHAAYSRVGRNGHTQVDTAGFAAAVFDHRTSRAGDPQLHTHALVLNKLHCPDGEWRTVDGHEIYAHKKSAGVIYQAALRSELSRRLGVSWTGVSRDGQAEIVGVPTQLVQRWSTRTGQVIAESAPVVVAYETALGRPLTSAERTAVAKVAVIKTRLGKEQVDIVSLLDRWHSEAAGLGWNGDRLEAAIGAAAVEVCPLTAADLDRLVLDAVLAAGGRKAVFTRSDLAAEVAARLPTTVDASTVVDWTERLTDRALATSEAVELLPERDGPVRASDARYASATTLNQELEILGVAEAGRGVGVAVCPPGVVLHACRTVGLDYTQAHAVNLITRNGDQVSVLVAPAGTGKTTTLAAAVAAWHACGVPVMALAPSARAAKELATATGLPTDTVAKYLYEQQTWPVDPRYWLEPGGVLIIDEASMLATADLHTLTRDVQAAGGKLLMVGDPAQIGAIDAAGGMLAPLADRLAAPSLTQVHRMRHGWERLASLQLRAGDPESITAYLEHDRIHPIGPDADPYDTILADYQQLTADGTRVLLLARSHDDVDQLNLRARTHAIKSGDVHGDPLITVGGHEWRIGDRLRVTRNNRRIPIGTDHLRNGEVFTVTGHNGLGLSVQRLHGAEVAVLPRDYLARHADYGWASTIDTAQGSTVDHALLLARPGLDRTRLYVALTRGRQTNHVYLAGVPDPEIGPRDWQRRPLDPVDGLAKMLTTAGEQAAAHTRLPNPPALPSRIAPDPKVARPEPARWPARERDPYRLLHRHDEPYRGLSR